MITNAPPPLPEVSPEAYLAAELTADERSEFVAGRVYPMPGVSATHGRLSRNLGFLLHGHLLDSPCQVHGPDLKLRLNGGRIYYYPDLMVCCDPSDDADYWRERPRYIGEVSSPETERTDSREKAIAYFHLASVEAYAQIAQARLEVQVHRRAAEAPFWVTETLTRPTDELHLDGIGFRASLAQIYQRSGLLPDTD